MHHSLNRHERIRTTHQRTGALAVLVNGLRTDNAAAADANGFVVLTLVGAAGVADTVDVGAPFLLTLLPADATGDDCAATGAVDARRAIGAIAAGLSVFSGDDVVLDGADDDANDGSCLASDSSTPAMICVWKCVDRDLSHECMLARAHTTY
jgi:hypothetical protein